MTSLSTIASPAPQMGSDVPYGTSPAGVQPLAGNTAAIQFQAYDGQAREPVAGLPKQMDLGPMLLHTFLRSPMNKFERGDVIKKALMEWNTSGPSERARPRLESLMLSPDATRQVDFVDALMLHLMDTGVHGELVQGYIQSLKRSGRYDGIVAGLQSDHPGKTKEWAEEMLVKILSTWDGPLPADVNLDGYTHGEPFMDEQERTVFFEELLNPNRPPQYGEKKRSVCREAVFMGQPIPERCDKHIADLRETLATTANVATAASIVDQAVVANAPADVLPLDTSN